MDISTTNPSDIGVLCASSAVGRRQGVRVVLVRWVIVWWCGEGDSEIMGFHHSNTGVKLPNNIGSYCELCGFFCRQILAMLWVYSTSYGTHISYGFLWNQYMLFGFDTSIFGGDAGTFNWPLSVYAPPRVEHMIQCCI